MDSNPPAMATRPLHRVLESAPMEPKAHPFEALPSYICAMESLSQQLHVQLHTKLLQLHPYTGGGLCSVAALSPSLRPGAALGPGVANKRKSGLKRPMILEANFNADSIPRGRQMGEALHTWANRPYQQPR